MDASERKIEILKLLKKGPLEVDALSRTFNVSTMTVRRDLRKFDEQGLVYVSNGKAFLCESVSSEESYVLKKDKMISEKIHIAKKANEFINDNDVIYLDCGTTCNMVAEELAKTKKNVIVFTNSILVANTLFSVSSVELYMLPGKFRDKTMGFIGNFTIEFMRRFYFDKCFMGTEGIDLEHGISTPYMEDGNTKRCAIEKSKRIFIVTDHTKFGLKTSYSYVDVSDADYIITNDSDVDTTPYEDKGVKIIKV